MKQDIKLTFKNPAFELGFWLGWLSAVGGVFFLGGDIMTNVISAELKIMLDDNMDKALNYNLVHKDWKPNCFRRYTWCIDDEETIVTDKFSKPCLVCPFRLHKGKIKNNKPEYSYGDYIDQGGH